MDLRQLLPVPELDACRSILCVQPHPDDNEVGAGATIARLAAQGTQVTYVTVTDGSIGTLDPEMTPELLAATRRREAEAAGRSLGASRFYWLDFPDGRGLQLTAVRNRLVDVIRSARPQVIMAPDPWLAYEGHSDHRITGLAAVEACLLGGFPNFERDRLAPQAAYQPELVALYNTARPNTWVDAEATWGRKMEAIRLHQSQFTAGWDTMAFFLQGQARALAEGHNCNMAEAFKVLPPILLHGIAFTESY